MSGMFKRWFTVPAKDDKAVKGDLKKIGINVSTAQLNEGTQLIGVAVSGIAGSELNTVAAPLVTEAAGEVNKIVPAAAQPIADAIVKSEATSLEVKITGGL